MLIATHTKLALLDILQTPVWIFDIERMQMWWANQKALSLWNASSLEQLLSRDWSQASQSTKIRLQAYLKQFQHQQTVIEQWTFYPKERPISVRCVCSGISIESGRLAMLVEGAVDSMEQIDSDTLRSIEALRHTTVMISLYTQNGMILLQNPAAIACYGDEKSCLHLAENGLKKHFVDRSIFMQAMTCIRTGEVFSTETLVTTLQGIRWHQIEVRLTLDPATGASLILVNEHDVSDRKQAEIAWQKAQQAAEAASLAKNQFLAKMSHELRTPLNAILGFTQVMACNPSLSTQQTEQLKIINHSGEHLLTLINDILLMSQSESGQLTLNENRFDLYQLLHSVATMFQLPAGSKGLQLTFECTKEVPQYIQTDEGKLRQVLINLLDNAIKFTQSGSVTLRVMGNRSWVMNRNLSSQRKTSLVFQIEDTGPGIAAEELPRLFKPFAQTQTGQQSMQGTGLGLAINQQFVRLMEGDITVSSQQGKGTTFTFDIQVTLVSDADEKTTFANWQAIRLEPNQPTDLTTSSYPLTPLKLPTSQDLSSMPREWAIALHQAVQILDEQQIIALLQQIPETQSELYKALTHLVNNFRLDIIIELTQAYIDE
jgi:signal transduction histidine kinase